jgi:hypothetical protein
MNALTAAQKNLDAARAALNLAAARYDEAYETGDPDRDLYADDYSAARKAVDAAEKALALAAR